MYIPSMYYIILHGRNVSELGLGSNVQSKGSGQKSSLLRFTCRNGLLSLEAVIACVQTGPLYAFFCLECWNTARSRSHRYRHRRRAGDFYQQLRQRTLRCGRDSQGAFTFTPEHNNRGRKTLAVKSWKWWRKVLAALDR